MAITIDWGTKVISVPLADLTLIDSDIPLYQLDVDWFRLQLKDLEDGEEGMMFPDTHVHNTEVVLSGVTYNRFVEIVNGYTVTFEDGQYAVSTVGANHNITDVKNLNQVSLITNNSAGLQTVETPAAPVLDSDQQALLIQAAEAELARKILQNRQEMYWDNTTWWLITYDDDGLAELFRNEIHTKDDGTVTVGDTVPAKRLAPQ